MNNEELKELYIYEDIVILKKIELLLKEHKIQFMVRSFEDSAYDGLFTMSMGKGKLFVFEKDHDSAVQLLRKENIL